MREWFTASWTSAAWAKGVSQVGATWNSVHDVPKGLIKLRLGGSRDSNMESDLLVSYMEVLQPLQCHFDGASVLAGFALALEPWEGNPAGWPPGGRGLRCHAAPGLPARRW
ncbi:unnamed protein product [Symbiodinium natans]|uniref:Uncharacterized protein n=1 Tax=Symbiodinium natans TaxID=878477 RepID=A0A812TSK1_9DINO|nr:unnamed protein product [Symbiodinium natans]